MADIQFSFRRYEKKYLLTRPQYDALSTALATETCPDTYGQYTICNLYYDTPDFALIRASLEKPVYKEKLRMRSYGTVQNDGKVFVELKKKFDGVVYKRRTVMQPREAMDYLTGAARPKKENQIIHEIDWFLKSYDLSPRVFLAYDRLALTGRENPNLRLTFDTNLRWRDTELDLRYGDCGSPLLTEDLVLLEVKLPGTAPLWLSHLLSTLEIFPTSFSKYGVCYRDHLVKRPYILKKEASSCA